MNTLKLDNEKIVEILAFALMPNHYHFLLVQLEDKGISNFIRLLQNGFAKYTNIKNERSGSVFQSMFKAVRIESEEQLMHVGRYIHLNPFTGYVLNDIKLLSKYMWNSYSTYLGNRNYEFLDKQKLSERFKSIKKFAEFTENQADYQRELKNMEYVVLDNP